mmetsp:Transcript_6899/g.10177  ORF Transcript_6899/g.10177 Transcript_6899/m.10177 type:complete len:321 (-) Transcript_6899:161-1123(-)
MGSTNSKGQEGASPTGSSQAANKNAFPRPSGSEYDDIDEVAASLPQIIDEESRAEVDEYLTSCDNGNGPAVACHAAAEYLSVFERKHKEAVELYENACYRNPPANSRADRLTQGCEDMGDGTVGYAPACFNLARFRMTGKGHTKFSHKEGFDNFERACKARHTGGCLFLAKMLVSPPGSFEGVNYDPYRAMELFQFTCDEGDSVACFTLAGMLLKGAHVDPSADNVSPQEARGEQEIKTRKGETERRRKSDDDRLIIKRDPPRAEKLFAQACDRGHGPSCFNLAVMYKQGDDGVPMNKEKHELYKKKTEKHVEMFGGLFN